MARRLIFSVSRSACVLGATMVVIGCAANTAGSWPPSNLVGSGNWVVVQDVTLQPQSGKNGCGPAALRMVLGHWGVADNGLPEDDRHGTRAGELRDRARQLGFESFVLPGTVDDLHREISAGHPVVVGVARRERLHAYLHFVVVVGAERGLGEWLIADPDRGWRRIGMDELLAEWNATDRVMIVTYPAQAASPTERTERSLAQLLDTTFGRRFVDPMYIPPGGG